MLRRVTIKGFHHGILIVFYMVCIGISAISCGSDTTGNKADMEASAHEMTGCSSPPPESVYMCRNRQKEIDDIVSVDITLSSTVPVIGAAFDIIYDPDMVEVVRKPDSSIDFSPPDQTVWKYMSVVQQDSQDGVLVVGTSRGRGMPPLTGNLPVVTLKFKSLSGEGHLKFSNNNILDSSGQLIETFKDRWFGLYLTP